MCYFGLWYWLNIQFNIINKQIYNYFPFPWFVSAVHLAVGLLIMTFFWTTRLVKYEKPDKEFLKAVTLPSFLHAFGHCLTNVSFAAVAVSLTHTIKTLEPVFSAAGSFLVSGTVYALPVYLALLPIIGGVALASATDLSFSWLGFSTAMASNVAFSARAIFSKKLMARMSPLNLYNFVTIVSLLFCIRSSRCSRGRAAAGIQKPSRSRAEGFDRAVEGWRVLPPVQPGGVPSAGKVEPVTHAVGNVGKRIFVIGFTILAFGNKISPPRSAPASPSSAPASTAGSRRSTRTRPRRSSAIERVPVRRSFSHKKKTIPRARREGDARGERTGASRHALRPGIHDSGIVNDRRRAIGL